jgi:hypothetical protein
LSKEFPVRSVHIFVKIFLIGHLAIKPGTLGGRPQTHSQALHCFFYHIIR